MVSYVDKNKSNPRRVRRRSSVKYARGCGLGWYHRQDKARGGWSEQ